MQSFRIVPLSRSTPATLFEEYQQIDARPEPATMIKAGQQRLSARDNAPEMNRVSKVACYISVPFKAYVQYSTATIVRRSLRAEAQTYSKCLILTGALDFFVFCMYFEGRTLVR